MTVRRLRSFCCRGKNSRLLRNGSISGLKRPGSRWRRGEKKMSSRGEFSAMLLAALATIFLAKDAAGEDPEVPPLQLETKIPLGDIRGRIDHMAVDLGRHRL